MSPFRKGAEMKVRKTARKNLQGAQRAAPAGGSSKTQRLKAAATAAAMVGGMALGAVTDPAGAARASLSNRVAAVRQALARRLNEPAGVEQRDTGLPYPAVELAQWLNWGNWGNWNNWRNWNNWANAWTNWVNV
jgi:hypothetical protein